MPVVIASTRGAVAPSAARARALSSRIHRASQIPTRSRRGSTGDADATTSTRVVVSVRARAVNEDPSRSRIVRVVSGEEVPGRRRASASATASSPPRVDVVAVRAAAKDALETFASNLLRARRVVAALALASVIALFDASPALAGRGGGRSGGRMGGSSFRPSAARSMGGGGVGGGVMGGGVGAGAGASRPPRTGATGVGFMPSFFFMPSFGGWGYGMGYGMGGAAQPGSPAAGRAGLVPASRERRRSPEPSRTQRASAGSRAAAVHRK